MLLRRPSTQASRGSREADSKAHLARGLRELFVDCLRLREQGARADRLYHARGQAEGYARALVDAGFFEESEVLAILHQLRQKETGSVWRAVSLEEKLESEFDSMPAVTCP